VPMSSEAFTPKLAALGRTFMSCMTLALIIGTGRAAPRTRELTVVIHLLHFDSATGLTTRTSEGEARRVIAEANRIWSRSGISIVIDAVRREKAVPNAAALGWLTTSHEDEGPDAVLANLALIRPPDPVPASLHIHFIVQL